AFAEFAERQAGINFTEREDGFRSGIILAHEALAGAPPDGGGGAILLDEDVSVQRRNREIRGAFFLLINAPRALAHDFENQCRIILKMITQRIRPADDLDVGIIKTRLICQADAHFRVRIKWAATLTAKLISER